MAEDGMLYMTDGWSDVYKIDVRDGKKGRILWKMDPTVDRSTAWIPSNRGVVLYANQVISITTDGRVLATDKETGKVLWDKDVKLADTDTFTGAPLLIKDMIIIPGSGADIGGACWPPPAPSKDSQSTVPPHSHPPPRPPPHYAP